MIWALLLVYSFDILGVREAHAQSIVMAPPPGVELSIAPPSFIPNLKAISLDPNDPFKINFVVDAGSHAQVDEEQSRSLIKYFLTFLTFPAKDLWVNLSPAEPDRIVNPVFGATTAGKDMLTQDYFLKQIAASMTNPEHELGKKFWEQVYIKIRQQYGNVDVPLNSVNKVWVIPESAVVYEKDGAAFISGSRLKVLLDEDYLSMKKIVPDNAVPAGDREKINGLCSTITREIIIPEIEREVNDGPQFAQLRQMYHALILAIWFKRQLKSNIVNQIYAGRKKIAGIDTKDRGASQRIYEQYMLALKQGAYDMIREEYDPGQQEAVPRRYFSGGFSFEDAAQKIQFRPVSFFSGKTVLPVSNFFRLKFSLLPKGVSRKLLLVLAASAGLCTSSGCTITGNDPLPGPAHPAIVERVTPIVLEQPGQDAELHQGTKTRSVASGTLINRETGEETIVADLDIQGFIPLTKSTKLLVGYEGGKGIYTIFPAGTFVSYGLPGGNNVEKHDVHPRSDGTIVKKLFVPAAVPAPEASSKAVPIKYPPAVEVSPAIRVADQKYADAGVAKMVEAEMAFVKPYVISAKTPLVLDEAGLTAQVGGIVLGLDQSKGQYKQGDIIFSLIDPERVQQREGLARRLVIEEGTYRVLKGLQAQGGATVAELTPVEERINELRRQLAQADQKGSVEAVKAPCDLSIKEVLVANGMTVNKGVDIVSYYYGQRARLNIEIPVTQTYFGRIRNFRIDGQPVKNIVSVDWQLNPKKTGAIVSFLVTTSSMIPPNSTVQVEAEIFPPLKTQANFDAVRGQAQTLAMVRKLEERVMVAPARGPVKFFVKEGDRVEAGQVVAEVVEGSYFEEYRGAVKAFNSIQAQLAQAGPDGSGVRHTLRGQEAELEARRASLRAQILTLQGQISRLRVVATESGVVTGILSEHSSSFSKGDELLRVRTGRVTVGDINDMNTAILLPKDVKLGIGDPVLVQAPSGERLAGRVSAVNEAPVGREIDLGPVKAVAVIVDGDRNGVLWVNLPVQIIVPTEAESPVILAALGKSEQDRINTARQQDGVLAQMDPRLVFRSSEAGVKPLPVQMGEALLRLPVQPAANLNITEVVARVSGNNFLNGELTIDVLKSKASERLSGSSRLALQAGVFVNNNGKLAFSGGLNGVFDDVMAGVSTGNAIAAASPIVFSVAGEIMDVVSGKKLKEKALALKMTQIAQHHMEDAVAGQVNDATALFVEIGRAQQHIVQLQALVADLEEAQKGLKAREAGGFATTSDLNVLAQQTGEFRAQLLSWQNKKKQSTIELNQMLGRPAERLQEDISPKLLWDGEFLAIAADQQESLRHQLTGEGSPNYRLRGAQVARAAVEETIKLQGSEYLPTADLTGLFISGSQGQAVNPLYDLSPGSKMRTSSLTTGGNGALHFELPIFDSGRDARKEIVLLERAKVQLHLDTVKAELGEAFTKAVSEIRDLSRQIEQGEAEHKAALNAWQEKAGRPDLYRKDQLVDEHQRMAKAFERLIDLKAEYFKAEARLGRIQVMKQDQSLVRPSRTRAAAFAPQLVSAVAGGSVFAGDIGEGQLTLDLSGFGPGQQGLNSKRQDPGVLSAGAVIYPVPGVSDGKSGSNLWALMSNPEAGDPRQAQIDIAVGILTQDSNIRARAEAMKLLTEELSNDRRSLSGIEQAVLNSPYSEVVVNLLQFAVNRDGHDVRFLTQVIEKAIDQRKPGVAGVGFEMLSDILIQDPGAVGQLAGQGQSGAGRRALLAFLSWAPEDSVARSRLLQSDYWTSDQLAQTYNTLKGQAGSVPQGLAVLIYDEILRREALGNMEDVFYPGPFANLSSVVFDKDLRALVMLREWSSADRRFLMTSPRWREMKDFIAPALYERAKIAAGTLVSLNGRAATGLDPFLSGITAAGGQGTSSLAYFNGLNLEDQKRQIARTNNIPELARILRSQTSLRGMALDRLMTTALGRMMALQVYAGSNDKGLLDLVDSRHWVDILRADVQAVDNPASNDVYRHAMEKMADRVGEKGLLNVRLGTYTLPELHAASDPRGEAPRMQQIKVEATRLALDLIAERANHQMRWLSGQAAYTPREQALIRELKQRIGSANDPQEVNEYLDQLSARGDKTTNNMVRDIVGLRDKFSGVISGNDQGFPRLTVASQLVLALVGGLLFWVGAKKIRKDILRKMAKTGDMIRELRQEFAAESGNGNGKVNIQGLSSDVVIIPNRGLDEAVIKPLQSWRTLVSQWRHVQPGPQAVLSDLNAILNSAFDILRKTPYTPELMLRQGSDPILNERYQVVLSHFNLLAIDTINAMNDLLQRDDASLDDYQKQKLLGDAETLARMMEYVTTYLRILEYRGIIDKVMNYKFADDHWAERFKIYPFMRWALLYSYQLTRSERQIKKEVPDLLRQGNTLMPSFYGDPGDIEQQSKSVLSAVIKNASNLTSLGSLTARNNHKMRSFISRLRLFSVPFGFTIFGVMVLFGVTGTMGLSLAGIAAVAISMGIFWVPHANIMQMSWSKTMKSVTDKLVSDLRGRLGASVAAGVLNSSDENSVQLAVKDGMKKLRWEIAPENERSIDMLVILPENPDADDVDSLKQYVDSRRGSIFREDVPVEVLPAQLKGSGNAYLEAVQFVQSRLQDSDFTDRYPYLKGIPWSDLKVMFVFAGSRELRSDSVLDWSVINGYRTSACMNGPCSESSSQPVRPGHGAERGGHILIYSRDAYFGPMQGFEGTDIGLLGNWVDGQALKGLGLLNIDVTRTRPPVREILEKLDIGRLQENQEKSVHPSKILQYLREKYDLKNNTLKQFPALTGVMILGPRVVATVTDLLDQLGKKTGLAGQLKYLNFTNDILNVFVKPESEISKDYPEIRTEWADIQNNYEEGERADAFDLFRSFYLMLSQAKRRNVPDSLTVNAALPYPGDALLIHINGTQDVEAVNRLLGLGAGGSPTSLPWLSGVPLPEKRPILEVVGPNAEPIVVAESVPQGGEVKVSEQEEELPAGQGSKDDPVVSGLTQEYSEYATEIGVLTKMAEGLRGEKGASIPEMHRKQIRKVNSQVFVRTEEFAKKVSGRASESDPVLAGLAQQYLQYATEVEAIQKKIEVLRAAKEFIDPAVYMKQLRSLYGQISARKNFRMTPLRKQILSRLAMINNPSQDNAAQNENGGVDLSDTARKIRFEPDHGVSGDLDHQFVLTTRFT